MKGANSIPRELMDSLLLSIVSFMNKAGMKPKEIEQSFNLGMQELMAQIEAGPASSRRGGSSIGCDTIAGAVLRDWYRDPRYLDKFANPVPLAILGRGRSLASLVRLQDATASAKELALDMHRTGLIKKVDGDKYLPTTSAATISQLHPFAVDHVVKTVLRLVETVTRNMRLVESQHPLVERYAHIPDLDAKEAAAFSEFSRQQGAACLEAIEDWLEARRKGRSSPKSRKGASVSAGMHVFAYLEQPSASKAARPQSPRMKASTSSRAVRA